MISRTAPCHFDVTTLFRAKGESPIPIGPLAFQLSWSFVWRCLCKDYIQMGLPFPLFLSQYLLTYTCTFALTLMLRSGEGFPQYAFLPNNLIIWPSTSPSYSIFNGRLHQLPHPSSFKIVCLFYTFCNSIRFIVSQGVLL